MGVRAAVSIGILQAVRPLPEGYGLNGTGSRAWVQADIRLAPGNSGGPIADVEGNVIGVSAMIVSGLALAVPAPDVEQLLSSLG
jgi:S1-C subfamily serine protease